MRVSKNLEVEGYAYGRTDDKKRKRLFWKMLFWGRKLQTERRWNLGLQFKPPVLWRTLSRLTISFLTYKIIQGWFINKMVTPYLFCRRKPGPLGPDLYSIDCLLNTASPITPEPSSSKDVGTGTGVDPLAPKKLPAVPTMFGNSKSFDYRYLTNCYLNV